MGLFDNFDQFDQLTPSCFAEGADDNLVRDLFERIFPVLRKMNAVEYDLNRFCTAAFYFPTVFARSGRNLKSLTALEVGCGNGLKSNTWASLFKEYIAVDLDESVF